MNNYPIIIAFLIGLTVGVVIVIYGLLLGFKLSAEIRRFKGDDSVEESILPGRRDPAEFALIPKEDEEE